MERPQQEGDNEGVQNEFKVMIKKKIKSVGTRHLRRDHSVNCQKLFMPLSGVGGAISSH